MVIKKQQQNKTILTLLYLVANEPVSNEWKIIIVSSKSQTNTRSKLFSGSEAGGLDEGLPTTRLPLPRPIRSETMTFC